MGTTLKASRTAGKVATHGSHAPPPLAAREPTHCHRLSEKIGGSRMSFSSLSSCINDECHRYMQKRKIKQDSLFYFLFFSDLFLISLFSFPLQTINGSIIKKPLTVVLGGGDGVDRDRKKKRFCYHL
jgi:hypothetical protein